MKRIVSLCMALILALLAATAVTVSADGETLTVSANGSTTGSYTVGQEIVFYLNLDVEDTEIINGDIRITYDPEYLEFVPKTEVIGDNDPEIEAYSLPRKIYSANAFVNASNSGQILFNFSKYAGIGTLTGYHKMLARFRFLIKKAGSTDISSQIYTMCDKDQEYIYYKGNLRPGYQTSLTALTMLSSEEKPYVAKQSGYYYTSFENAVLDRESDDDVVTLLANIDEPYVLSAGSTLKVKKEGFSLRVVAPENSIIGTSASGNVTVYTAIQTQIKYSMNLSLSDSIDVNCYVKNLPADYCTQFKVAYTYHETTTEEFCSAVNNSFTVASCTAKDMNDVVHIAVYAPDGTKLREWDYSVKTYCNNKLKPDSGESELLKSLCTAVKIYGAEAQKYFNYRPDEPVMAYSEYDIGLLEAVPADYDAVLSGSCDKVSGISATLMLESQTKLNFYITPVKGFDADGLTVKLNGNEITRNDVGAVTLTKLPEGVLRLTVSGIRSIDLANTYTVSVGKGSETNQRIIQYSPLSYAYRNQNNTGTSGICKALYNYYQKAVAYFPAS